MPKAECPQRPIYGSRPMQSMSHPRIALAPRTTVEMAEFAATQIRDAIINGQYRPGDRLIENDLATQLQISRHPVREALRRLGREGFVTMRANRGAVVAEVDAMSILEVYEIRAVPRRASSSSSTFRTSRPFGGVLEEARTVGSKGARSCGEGPADRDDPV